MDLSPDCARPAPWAPADAPLSVPMRRALELAWESFVAGSFGIGAVATTGRFDQVAEGRNRILEPHPGDDALAGSSVAHAEMNVLAKLPYRHHEDDDLQLFTTLQPCVQCLGAIRLSPVRRVHVLAPDPLFRGIERIVHVNEFLGRNWPSIDQLDVTPWSAFAVLLPTHLGVFWEATAPGWADALPDLTQLATELVASSRLVDLAREGADLDTVIALLWPRLEPCVAEIATLAADS